MKPIHKATCAGLLGALIAFAIASFAGGEGSSVPDYDGMVLIVCGPYGEDVRPWCSAFAGYALVFTPVMLFTSRRIRSDIFRHDNAA